MLGFSADSIGIESGALLLVCYFDGPQTNAQREDIVKLHWRRQSLFKTSNDADGPTMWKASATSANDRTP